MYLRLSPEWGTLDMLPHLSETEFPKKQLAIWVWNTGGEAVLVIVESVNTPQEQEFFFCLFFHW